jgi:SAM-dependent methyltransferase
VSGVKWLLHNYGRKSNCQRFGRDPASVRESSHYGDEYVYGLVERWDDLIDWTARARNEAQFIIAELKRRGTVRVLDAATGTGFDSIQLIHAGFRVTSMDGSHSMLIKARKNAKKQGVKLNIIHSDWRRMSQQQDRRYDAVICLGNSFSHLFTTDDQLKSLAAFYHCLKPFGVLVTDHFNYDRIFKFGEFNRHSLYYSGKNVTVGLEYFDQGLMRFSYLFPFNWIFFLHFFPIPKGYLEQLLSVVGFTKIDTYGDFRPTFCDDETEFFIYVAQKLS